MLVGILGRIHIVNEGVVFVGAILVAADRLGVEQEYLAIFQTDNEIHIKESSVPFSVDVWNGVVCLATVTILIPPVNVLLVFLQEGFEVLFRIRGILYTDKRF